MNTHNYAGQQLLCVGGPLDGQRVPFDGLHILQATIPQPVAREWGINGIRPYVADIIKTHYEIKRVGMTLPGLHLSGAVYAWAGNRDTNAQLLMKLLAGFVATSESEVKRG